MIAGFLGAGKTTLLNRLLLGSSGERVAVVVNDFGDVTIDERLVVRRDDTTIALANGCICCTIRDDLIATLQRLLQQDPRPDRIVVEMSGIADPAAAVRTIRLIERRWPLDLDGVVALVDAEQFPQPASEHYVLAREQLALADLVVINKVDLVTPRQLTDLRARLADYVPHARVAEAAHGDVPLDVLLGRGPTAAAPVELAAAGDAGHAFRSVTYRCGEPMSLERLRAVVTELPSSVYRVKGFVHLAERPDHQTVLQVVGRRARIDLGEPWGERERETLLLAIGSSALDEHALLAQLDSARGGQRLSRFSEPLRFLRALWPRPR